MLHTKPQGQWPFGSGEDFEGFLLYMSMVAILVTWPGSFEQTLIPPSQWGSINWNLALIGPVVSEEKMFEECGRQTDGACLYYKLIHEPKGSGGLERPNFQSVILLISEIVFGICSKADHAGNLLIIPYQLTKFQVSLAQILNETSCWQV